MSNRIKITIADQELEAELNQSESSTALLDSLPVEFSMTRWGDEYYGDIGVPLNVTVAADARTEMEVGEIAYWKPGNALCIFFGPTPVSAGNEPRAASEVNPLGKLRDGAEMLKKLGSSVTVKVESIDAS